MYRQRSAAARSRRSGRCRSRRSGLATSPSTSPTMLGKLRRSRRVDRDLSVLHAILSSAQREELVEPNPAERAERPKLPPRRGGSSSRPRSLASPAFQRRSGAARVPDARPDRAPPAPSYRRSAGATSTSSRASYGCATCKTEEGVRVDRARPVPGRRAHGALAAPTPYKGDDERVFPRTRRRGAGPPTTLPRTPFRAALEAAGITDYVRPFHDARHSSLTNGAGGGEGPVALMAPGGASVDAGRRRRTCT